MMDKSAIFDALWAAWGALPACCERENNADFFSRPQVIWGMSV